MNAIPGVSAWQSAVFTGRQLDVIRHTVAKDCSPDEFNLFIAAAQRAGLDPFRRQISALVFNKKHPEKRRLAIITGIDGLRALAARSGRYRPDEAEPQISYLPDLKAATNPLGVEKALARIFIRDADGSDWRPVAGVAYWDEFAPIAEEWAEDPASGRRRPTGKLVLDPASAWARMGRVMIAKCAEAQALRKAFPEDLSGLYESSELDQARAADLTPSAILAATAEQDRLEKVGAAGAILFQLRPDAPLEPIPLGQVADKVLAAYQGFDLAQAGWFDSVNRASLQEFWARAKTDALGLKREIERRRLQLEADAAHARPAQAAGAAP
jgi:phage recombination protein Bet